MIMIAMELFSSLPVCHTILYLRHSLNYNGKVEQQETIMYLSTNHIVKPPIVCDPTETWQER